MNDGLYLYLYLPAYHYFQRPDSAVNSYGVYKKVDDLEVLERCMTGAGAETRQVLLCRQYIPSWCVTVFRGIRSVDKRDELAGRMVRGKILSGRGMFCRARVGCWMKMKLMVCVLPVSLLKLITGAYNWGKSALAPKMSCLSCGFDVII